MTLVQAEKLAFNGRLHSTDLALEGGTLTCLVGPNGSGKTSLLHAIARIGGPSGTVRVGGQALHGLLPPRRAQLLAFLPASRDLTWPIAARDLIVLSGAEPARIEEMIRRLELEPFAARRADCLSTGERSRVLIARALATRPRVLLLDEPTANLDPLWQIRLMAQLREEVSGEDRAALVAMHDLDAAGRYADRLLVMHSGRIAADGPPAEVLASPVIPQIFGIEPTPGGWRPAFSPSADP